MCCPKAKRKKKALNPAEEPDLRQQRGARGVLLSQPWMGQCWPLEVLGMDTHCCSVPLLASPDAQLHPAGEFPWEILLPILLRRKLQSSSDLLVTLLSIHPLCPREQACSYTQALRPPFSQHLTSIWEQKECLEQTQTAWGGSSDLGKRQRFSPKPGGWAPSCSAPGTQLGSEINESEVPGRE